MHQQMESDKGNLGMLRGQQAKQRLQRQRKLAEIENERKIDKLILETSKSSALRAVNLSQLLKKKWTEESNSYQILSSLKDDKMERRVRNLLSDSMF